MTPDNTAQPAVTAERDRKIVTALKITANELPEGKDRDAAFDALHLIGRLYDAAPGQGAPVAGAVPDEVRAAHARTEVWRRSAEASQAKYDALVQAGSKLAGKSPHDVAEEVLCEWVKADDKRSNRDLIARGVTIAYAALTQSQPSSQPLVEQGGAAGFKPGDRVRWHHPPVIEGTVLKHNGGLVKVQWDTGEVRRDEPAKLRPTAPPATRQEPTRSSEEGE